MNTVRMAAAALRSASDDLRKSGTTHPLNLSMSSRIVAMSLAEGHPVSLFELGLLVLDVAQCLDRE